MMLTKILSRITRTVELITAITLAVIFVTFLLQIFTRYAPKIAWLMPVAPISDWMMSLEPIGWTINLISFLWVWLIFFGCAFLVREKEHVTFDMLFLALPRKAQKIMLFAGSVCIIVIMLYSFGPTWDAIFTSRLMELKKIQTLRVPITGDKIAIKWLFASYILFMVAVIVRHGWRILQLSKLVPNIDLNESTHTVGTDGEDNKTGDAQ